MKADEVRKKLTQEYPIKYKRFSAIVGTDLWKEILDAASDDITMSHIIFCNDVMRIPPVKTFLMITKKEDSNFEDDIKKCLGSVFGYIFCELLKYNKKKNITCTIANFRSASRFMKE